MIVSFEDADTELLWQTGKSRRIPASIRRVAQRKLQMLHVAGALEDLLVPPGNRLEMLKGDRDRQHSIRVNDQYRVCFVWRDNNAYDVEVVDYH
jgi:proteic killer suppression protein